MGKHIPVLLNETIAGLNIKPDGIYMDLTLGRGGHSGEILKKLTTGHLYGIDQDQEAIKESQKYLETISKNFTLIHENFSNLEKVLTEIHLTHVDGILMDLGVSSPQFDDTWKRKKEFTPSVTVRLKVTHKCVNCWVARAQTVLR